LGAKTNIPGAILSIPIKGADLFAHVACGTTGNAACIADPSPSLTWQYDWSEYYFTRFVNDLFVPGTMANQYAIMGFAAACIEPVCSPAAYALTPWQLSLVYTGLNPTVTGANYSFSPTCWLNNTNPNNLSASSLRLYSSPTAWTTVDVIGPAPAPRAPAGGTMLGWQTQTDQAAACQTGHYSLQDAIDNGRQSIEIETDAASEPTCGAKLQNALATLLSPTTSDSCLY
jgi:hypothetical protein